MEDKPSSSADDKPVVDYWETHYFNYRHGPPRTNEEFQDLYEKGHLLYTKKGIEDLERHLKQQLASQRMDPPKKDPFKLLLLGPSSINYTLREWNYNNNNKKEVRIKRKVECSVKDPSRPFHVHIDFNRYQELRDTTIPPINPNGDTKLKSADVACPLIVSLHDYDPLAETYIEAPDTLWEEHKKEWEESPLCKEVIDMIKEAAIPLSTNKIVCFGLGNFATFAWELKEPVPQATRTSEPWWKYNKRRMVTQHAAALTIRKALQEKRGKIELIAQEPDYDEDTVRILEKEGFEIVKGLGALGFTRVDDNTLVFSIDNDIPVKQVVADIAKPAAMIWNSPDPAYKDDWKWVDKWKHWDMNNWMADTESPRTKALEAEYEELSFPGATDKNFTKLSLFVRKDGR